MRFILGFHTKTRWSFTVCAKYNSKLREGPSVMNFLKTSCMETALALDLRRWASIIRIVERLRAGRPDYRDWIPGKTIGFISSPYLLIHG